MAEAYIDHTNLTFEPEEARTTADLVFEDVFVKPNSITDVHDVTTGVVMKKRIPILGSYGDLGKVDNGDCSSNVSTGQIPSSEKMWEPVPVSFRIIECNEKVPAERKFWRSNGDWKDRWEDQSSEEVAYVTERLTDATYASVLRISEWGDTDASPVGDGTGDENLTVGTDKTLFNMLDGMWKQIFTDQALGTPLTFRHTITENGLASKALQMALGATAAVDAMKDLYEGIDSRARKAGNLVYQATSGLFFNYMTYLETNSLAFTLEVLEDGKQALKYRGVTVIERADWTERIETSFDLGTTYLFPHRMILTPLSNIPVGTSDTNSMESIDSFYDKKEKSHYMDVAYNIDMKILLEYALASAY